jgi:hypothetical protein
MKILYRILVILLWIPIILFLFLGLPIALIISPVIYLFTGRTEGLFFDMHIKGVDYLIDVVEMLAKKGE